MNENVNGKTETELEIEDRKQEEIMKKNTPFFAVSSVLYALFFTICLYKNASGITAPFFVGGTLWYFYLCIKKFRVPLKKNTWFYISSILLLGISTFLTDDGRIIALNHMGVFVLMISFMLHQFYQDETWGFGKQIGAFMEIMVSALASMGAPFSHISGYINSKKEVKKDSKLKYVFIGLAISMPLLMVVVALLVSADRIFGDFFGALFKGIMIPANLFGIVFYILFAFFGSYCFMAALARKRVAAQTNKKEQEPIIAITFTSLLSAIYIVFSGIQLFGLFLGKLKLPEHYTYAMYAREGFFQLLFVCVINLVLVLLCMGLFKESKVLKGLLVLISACTYIMIASSAFRMMLYIRVYYLTFLRIFVLWSLFVLFLIITGVIITIIKGNFPLFQYSMVLVTGLYIILAFSHPDYFIAKVNLQAMATNYKSDQNNTSEAKEDLEASQIAEANDGLEYSEYKYEDYYFITMLSADAASVIKEYAINNKEDMSFSQMEDTKYYFNNSRSDYENMTLRTFNISRYLAGKTATNYFANL